METLPSPPPNQLTKQPLEGYEGPVANTEEVTVEPGENPATAGADEDDSLDQRVDDTLLLNQTPEDD